jgi:hypothetical protein
MPEMGIGSGPKTAPAFDPRNPNVYVFSNEAANCAARKYTTVVDQEPVRFLSVAGNPQAIPIIWHLQTPGYSFAKMLDPSGSGEIYGCGANGNTAHCTNKGQNPGVWKYTISITAVDGCNPPDFDPYISND